MKKLCLLVFLLAFGFSVSSCSDESGVLPNVPEGELLMIVDGAQKNYNNVTVTQKLQANGDIMLEVTGSQNGDPTEYISFRVKKYATGFNRTSRWLYTNDSNKARSETIDDEEYDVEANITMNNNNRLRGNFSGRLYNVYSRRPVFIDAGEFSYNYNLPQPQ
jgi:hypothetical protein